MSFTTINPATEAEIAKFELQSPAVLEKILQRSHETFRFWRESPLEARLNSVLDFAAHMHENRQALAEMITTEMGKPIKDALGEIDKCVSSCKTIHKQFPIWMDQNIYSLPGGYTVTRQPLGVVFGIMPWNFPFWQVVRFALPTILCGNSAVMKHSPNTWGSAELLEKMFNQAFPPGVYTNLRIDIETSAQVIADKRVHGVSLTGSRRAGMEVGKHAGENLKKCVLELGGSDAYVVLDDADIDLAAQVCSTSRMLNAGQSCVSAKRFIVTKKNITAFTEKMQAALAQKHFGDPFDAKSDFGPLARKDLRDQLHDQVKKSVAQGSKLTLGGEVPKQKGFFYPASILTGVMPGQVAFDEELFGPVAAIIEAKDEPEAMKLANLSRYGLGGAIFSKDVERAKKLATNEMEAGMVFINDFVKSDAMFPFGGVKDSGLGRELGREGCFEFTYVKTVFAK